MRLTLEEQMTQLEELSKPIVKFLNDNFGPYTSIIVENDSVKITDGICRIPITEYIKD